MKPKCYDCVHCQDIPGDAHKECTNLGAVVSRDPVGVRGGWCFWPLNFDPLWILECSGFKSKE